MKSHRKSYLFLIIRIGTLPSSWTCWTQQRMTKRACLWPLMWCLFLVLIINWSCASSTQLPLAETLMRFSEELSLSSWQQKRRRSPQVNGRMEKAWWSFQPSLKRKPKRSLSLKESSHQRAPIWQAIPLLHPQPQARRGVGAGAAHFAPWARGRQLSIGVSPQRSIKNILVGSQPRSLGCYTTAY